MPTETDPTWGEQAQFTSGVGCTDVIGVGLICSAVMACLDKVMRESGPPEIGSVVEITCPDPIPEPIWTGTKTRREYTERRPRRGKFKRRNRGK